MNGSSYFELGFGVKKKLASEMRVMLNVVR